MVVIITNKSGQLGNRIIIFAHFIVNACEYGYIVFNPSFDEYADYFKGSCSRVLIQYPKKMNFLKKTGPSLVKILRKLIFTNINLATIFLKKMHFKETQFHELIHLNNDEQQFELNNTIYQDLVVLKKIILISGWRFRDIHNFSKYKELIKDYFEPVGDYKQIINDFIKRIRTNCDILIGVHIRRGDYQNWMGGKYYFQDAVYSEYMKQLEGIFPNRKIKFLMCSNEIINDASFSNFRISMGLNHELMDMYSLAQCDFLIGPPSTFTNWASIYGNVPLYKIRDADSIITLENFEVIQY